MKNKRNLFYLKNSFRANRERRCGGKHLIRGDRVEEEEEEEEEEL